MITFTSANQHKVDMSANGAPTIQSSKSFSYWFKYPGSPAAVQAHICLFNSAVAPTSAVQSGTRTPNLVVWSWGGIVLLSVTAPTDSQWHHFGYTYDGTTHIMYLDGAQVTSSTAAVQTGTPTNITFGYTIAVGEYYEGSLDDLRLYDRALSAAEIQTIYSLQSRDKIVYGLVSKWAVNEGYAGQAASSIKDIAGALSNIGIGGGSSGTPVYGDSILAARPRCPTIVRK